MAWARPSVQGCSCHILVKANLPALWGQSAHSVLRSEGNIFCGWHAGRAESAHAISKCFHGSERAENRKGFLREADVVADEREEVSCGADGGRSEKLGADAAEEGGGPLTGPGVTWVNGVLALGPGRPSQGHRAPVRDG